MRINTTNFKTHLGKYLEFSMKEAVIIEKSGQPSAVLISYAEFEKLSRYEDFYWSKLAEQAEQGGYLGVTKTAKHLKRHA